MTILYYQVLVVLIAVLFLLKGFSHYLRKDKTIRELIAIVFFWGVIVLFVAWPEAFARFTKFLGFQSFITAIILFCLAILFYMVVSIFSRAEEDRKELVELVRKLAIKDAGEKHVQNK